MELPPPSRLNRLLGAASVRVLFSCPCESALFLYRAVTGGHGAPLNNRELQSQCVPKSQKPSLAGHPFLLRICNAPHTHGKQRSASARVNTCHFFFSSFHLAKKANPVRTSSLVKCPVHWLPDTLDL